MSRANFKLSAKKSLLACSLFALTACGGGGGSGDDSNGVELKAGLYDTTVVYGNGTSESALTLYSSTGEYVAAFGADEFSFGSFSIENGTIQGPGTDYNFFNTWQKAEGSASGSVASEERAVLDKTGGFASATVTVQRLNEFSEGELSFATFSSTYITNYPSGRVASLTIDSSGALTGSDSTGCVYNGDVSIPDSSVNIYEVSYTASNCGASDEASGGSRNGSFQGIGLFFEDPENGKSTYLAANNGQIVEFFNSGVGL